LLAHKSRGSLSNPFRLERTGFTIRVNPGFNLGPISLSMLELIPLRYLGQVSVAHDCSSHTNHKINFLTRLN